MYHYLNLSLRIELNNESYRIISFIRFWFKYIRVQVEIHEYYGYYIN